MGVSFSPSAWKNGQTSRILMRRSRDLPWIAGIDFPFGQSRAFIENIGWPNYWAGYVAHAGTLGRNGSRHAVICRALLCEGCTLKDRATVASERQASFARVCLRCGRY
jgi:hypothetical protein